MEYFPGLIIYSGLMYLFTFFLYKSEEKMNIWDNLTLYFAPIATPIVIVGCFFKVMLE